jgi:hypothetical protein
MHQANNNTSSLDGGFQDIQTITVKRLVPEARDLLVQHGCTMHDRGHEETLITFPTNTRRQLLWPRTISERSRILLPDGQELRQVFDRVQEINQLFIVLEHPEKREQAHSLVQESFLEHE